MLQVASQLASPPLVAADAQALPFRDESFDVVSLITAIEFIDDPADTLAEGCRVSRQGLLLGALNRCSRLGRSIAGRDDDLWRCARLLSVRELRGLVVQASQGRPSAVSWRTTLWPGWPGSLPLPWGDFIGMSVRWT
jgi:hypothetical protein